MILLNVNQLASQNRTKILEANISGLYIITTQRKTLEPKKLFVEKFSADEFYSTQSLIENKLGAEANNISFEDRKDILVKPMKVKARNGKITLKLNGEVNYVVVK